MSGINKWSSESNHRRKLGLFRTYIILRSTEFRELAKLLMGCISKEKRRLGRTWLPGQAANTPLTSKP